MKVYASSGAHSLKRQGKKNPCRNDAAGACHLLRGFRYELFRAHIPPFDVRLSEDGTATVDVTPTDNTFAYEVTVGESPDAWRFVRCVQVPDSSTPMAFADLVDVDCSTLLPSATGNPLSDIDQSDVDWAIQFINS